jgi:hypothetical protein
MEFQGMGEVASPKTLDAGIRMNELLNFASSGEEIYDRFINPKFKVMTLTQVSSIKSHTILD